MISEIKQLKLDSTQKQVLSDDKKLLFPCAAYIGEVHSFIDARIPLHWHPEWEMCFVDQGSIRLTITGSVITLHKGEGYFMNSNIMHGIDYNESGPCKYRSIVFDSSIIAGAPGSAFDTLYVQPFLSKGPSSIILKDQCWDKLRHHFEHNWKACKEEKTGYEFTSRTYLSEMFLEVFNHNFSAADIRPENLTEVRIQQLITWINDHISETIYLKDMADSLHISERECQRVFSDALHCSPTEYILKKRINSACVRLANTTQSITDISYQCGFESPSYFTNIFRRQIGCTPREYRNRVQSER